ncbi:phospholipase A1 member A-like isoform X2 [Eupeodes corollae]|uniref:phospholipase A1 member A-like isoform X2 n=1 Tax=Eupeodes corollae TaxID=290404 RepID=UPI00249369D1|nr:phospholipase A1 member A-like isoform X2 [Eupeodes corollae]
MGLVVNEGKTKYMLSSKKDTEQRRIGQNVTAIILRPQFSDSTRYELSEASEILKNPHFKKQETHLYFHGWKESQTSGSNNIPTTVAAYLKRKDVNLITVDYAKAAGERYFEVALVNIEELAPVLADAVIDLFEAGVDRKEFRVVGHSVGAQLAAMMGRNIIKKSNGKHKIYRMAALDPAFPLFGPFFKPNINQNDADFVQIIHTEAGTFGQPVSSGHVDFWPNGGRGQPGCGFLTLPLFPADICGHRRSWDLWAESVANVNNTSPKFLGFPSLTYQEFVWAGDGNLKNKPVEMGINCPMSARGDYYLKTNSESPFAKGMEGY